MNDIKKSQDKALGDLIERFKDLDKNIHIQTNLKNTIGRQIMDYFELLDIKHKDNVRLEEKVNMKKVSVRQIKKLLNLPVSEDRSDDSLFDNIMVEIDIEKTIDNLIYLMGVAEPMAKKLGERLKDLQESKIIELEIGRWENLN